MYYIYKPPSIKGCVQKSNFAIISYSHQKVSKRFWFMIFVFGFLFFPFWFAFKKRCTKQSNWCKVRVAKQSYLVFFFIVC